ncbi:MAG TPA: polyphosphate kinase 2 family protein [Candidatus Baltobacteraceae bacterium]|nr:polyphosphate kinase 2 family protein [Candidatus Baltobacteraceae bacterium]
MSFRKRFMVKPAAKVRLADIDPGFTGHHRHKSDAAAEIEADTKRLTELQYLLYAGNAHALLIVLQGLDASGKDGTISHVFSGLNPQGARVHAFKEPSKEELAHDFLWRAHLQTPARGEIVIFNRSHYEDVLIVRVHDLVPKSVWSKRYDLINSFEADLGQANVTILKFYLHMSEGEQLERFKGRLDDPHRRWKISEADYTERSYFKEYMKAYEDVLEETSTEYAPWFVIPSDHKWFRNLAVSKIVVETLETLNMRLPPVTVDLDQIRRKYHEAAARTGAS